MSNIFKKIEKIKKDGKGVSKAWEIFEASQQIYDQSMGTPMIANYHITKGSYSSNLSKKEYYANISTTTE